jgi:hypothetical protein
MKTLITIAMLIVMALRAQADDRCGDRRARREHHNWIIERQEAYQVQGPPTDRLLIGRRQIDGYRLPNNGGHIWFEGNSVVGVTR